MKRFYLMYGSQPGLRLRIQDEHIARRLGEHGLGLSLPEDTPIRVFSDEGGKPTLTVGRWASIGPDAQAAILARYPVCPGCERRRFDVWRGLNKCPKCATIGEYDAAVTPLLQKLGQVRVSLAPSGRALEVQAADDSVSFRLKAGALKGATWDDSAKALVAGRTVLERAWERLRPIPHETVLSLRNTVQPFGLTVDVDADGRTVYLQGSWLASLAKEEAPLKKEVARLDALTLDIAKKVSDSKDRYYVRSEEGALQALWWLEFRLATKGI